MSRRYLHGDDGGFALAIVMLAGMILVLITAVIASRAARQVGTVSGDVRWEQSLNVAESCLDVGLVALDDDRQWTTGETLDTQVVGTSGERDWAVTAADARSSQDLVATPEGECVVVKPSNADLLYAVGFTPDRSSTSRRVRVVRAELTAPSTTVQVARAFLTDEDLEVSGNPTFIGDAASAHANGTVDVSGNPTFQDGCLTASDGGTVTGNLNVPPGCPGTPFDQPEVEIPSIEPRDFWNLSEYDMCPDGAVRAGPAHPTLGGTAGSEPCSGLVIEPDAGDGYRGWEYQGCCDEDHWAEWQFEGNVSYDGAYYFYEGTAEIEGNAGSQNNPWRVLLIAEARGSCSQQVGGDIVLDGNMAIAPYVAVSAHSDNTFVVVAGRDVDWSGNGELVNPGVVAATEQIEIDGNPALKGGFVGEGRCDSSHDSIDATAISGNPTFRLDVPLDTPWAQGPGGLAVIGWDEL